MKTQEERGRVEVQLHSLQALTALVLAALLSTCAERADDGDPHVISHATPKDDEAGQAPYSPEAQDTTDALASTQDNIISDGIQEMTDASVQCPGGDRDCDGAAYDQGCNTEGKPYDCCAGELDACG